MWVLTLQSERGEKQRKIILQKCNRRFLAILQSQYGWAIHSRVFFPINILLLPRNIIPRDAFMMCQVQQCFDVNSLSGKSAIDHHCLVNCIGMKIKKQYCVELLGVPSPFNLSLFYSCSNKHPITLYHSSAEHLLPWLPICLCGK